MQGESSSGEVDRCPSVVAASFGGHAVSGNAKPHGVTKDGMTEPCWVIRQDEAILTRVNELCTHISHSAVL